MGYRSPIKLSVFRSSHIAGHFLPTAPREANTIDQPFNAGTDTSTDVGMSPPPPAPFLPESPSFETPLDPGPPLHSEPFLPDGLIEETSTEDPVTLASEPTEAETI